MKTRWEVKEVENLTLGCSGHLIPEFSGTYPLSSMVLFLFSFALSPLLFSFSVISPWYTLSPISLKHNRQLSGGGMGGGIVREFGGDRYTLLHLKRITSKEPSTGDSAQWFVAAWMGGEFGGEWVHVYAQLSPFTVHTTLLIGYTAIQNKMFS